MTVPNKPNINKNVEVVSDAHVFLTSFEPLQILCDKDNKKVIYQNPITSLLRYYRPIRFRFLKESTDVTKEEIRCVEESAKKLKPTELVLYGNKSCLNMFLSWRWSMARCVTLQWINKSSDQHLNIITIWPKSSRAFKFGLFALQARIRIFERVLHLAYKLPIKRYREKSNDEEKKS